MPDQTAYIRAQAIARGLDPAAVLAVSSREGLSGAIGDGGHAFGPWQLNNAGGVITGQFQGQTPQQINQWAWSPAGINYALDRIAKTAKGLKGNAAVTNIVRQFERPADPNGEVNGAIANYARYASAYTGGGTTPAVSPGAAPMAPAAPVLGAGPTPGLSDKQTLLLSLLGNGGKDSTVTNLLAQHMQAQTATAPSLGPPQKIGGAVVSPSTISGADTTNPLVKTAMTQLGKPYQWGGPAVLGKNTDCSGLIQATMAANGISVGRTTYVQWKQGTPVNPKDLQPGDAVFFHPGKNGPEHVGMYVGNGHFIEDPHTGSVVRIENLTGYPGFMGARRYT